MAGLRLLIAEYRDDFGGLAQTVQLQSLVKRLAVSGIGLASGALLRIDLGYEGSAALGRADADKPPRLGVAD